MGWNDDNYDPRVDGYGKDYGDRPPPSDFAEEDFERARKQKYPRGYGPPHNSPEDPDPEMEHYDQHDPSRLIDPGFEEQPSLGPPDPDQWHDDRKTGGILTQRDQWPDRVAGIQRTSYDGKGKTQSELQGRPKPVIDSDIHRVPGLYGEDEDDPYDVYAKPNPKGTGWDVIKQIGR